MRRFGPRGLGPVALLSGACGPGLDTTFKGVASYVAFAVSFIETNGLSSHRIRFRAIDFP